LGVVAGSAALLAGAAKCSNPFTAPIGISQQAMGYAIFGINAVAVTEFGIAAKQQGKYAKKASTEIDARKATQDLNSNLSDVYDERLEGYEGYLGVVEDLELEVPEGMEVPEEGAELPPEVETPPETNPNNQDDDPNKKPDDKDK
jgi:hypothetical protein